MTLFRVPNSVLPMVDNHRGATVAVDAMGFDEVMDLIVEAPSPVALRFSSPYCLVKVTGPKGDLSFSAKKGDNLRAALTAPSKIGRPSAASKGSGALELRGPRRRHAARRCCATP